MNSLFIYLISIYSLIAIVFLFVYYIKNKIHPLLIDYETLKNKSLISPYYIIEKNKQIIKSKTIRVIILFTFVLFVFLPIFTIQSIFYIMFLCIMGIVFGLFILTIDIYDKIILKILNKTTQYIKIFFNKI